jgi:hypothetical protein
MVSLGPAPIPVVVRLDPEAASVPLGLAPIPVVARLDPEAASVPLRTAPIAVVARLDPEAIPVPLWPRPVVTVTESVPLKACLQAVAAPPCVPARRCAPVVGAAIARFAWQAWQAWAASPIAVSLGKAVRRRAPRIRVVRWLTARLATIAPRPARLLLQPGGTAMALVIGLGPPRIRQLLLPTASDVGRSPQA